MKKTSKILGLLLTTGMFLGGCDKEKANVNPTDDGKTQQHDHNYGEWNITKPATCTEAGSKERVCSGCGEKETESIPKLDSHIFGEWDETKPATCKEAGSKERACSICGAKETEVLPKLDTHTFDLCTITSM